MAFIPPPFHRRVTVARRSLFQDRRRAALAAGGVAAALLLVLLMNGIVAGSMRQVTTYLRTSPADAIVSQRGVRTMFMSMSALAPETVDRVRAVDGVAWAEGLHYASSTVSTGKGREQSYVFGYDPNGRLGPRDLVGGHAPRSGEALLDRVAADRLGVSIGGQVQVFGESFRVSGLFEGGTSMLNTTAFLTAADYTQLRGPSVAYVFAGAEAGVPPGQLADRLTAALTGMTVQTRNRFMHEEASIVGDMAADLLQIMAGAGYIIALAVIALTLFTLTLAKLREHAIVKALGARNRNVGAIVLTQAVWSVVVALALATVLAVSLSALVNRVAPSLLVTIEPRSVLRAGVGALVVGALSSLVPLRRVFSIDPATAFRRAS